MKAEPSARPAWYRPGSADLVFLGLAVLILQAARGGMLDDPGLGWHLRNIDAMRARGGWLTEDPFTEPRDGPPRRWLSNQWLGEVPLWLGERWAGLEGIAAVSALVLAFMLRCLYRMLLRDGLPWPLAVFWTALAAVGTSCSWAARPNLFTMLFVLLTARACVQFHQGGLSWRATLWLWPLFTVWANVHGGFVAGFTLLGGTLLIETGLALLATDPEQRQAARGRSRHLALLLGGAFLATLLNPYGFSLYRWVFQLLGDPYFMNLHQEWQSPDFRANGAMRFESLVLLFPLLLAASRRRANPVELGLALLWLHFALTGFRYVPLWVVVAVPLLARSSLEVPWLQEQARRLQLTGEGGSLFRPRPGPAPWLWSVLFAVALLGWARGAEGRFARHKPEITPAPALDRLLQLHGDWGRAHGERAVVFHCYHWGGYLTWHGGPDFRNWIDDRNEVQGKEHIQDYFSIVETDPGWERKLDRARVALVCIQPQAPLTFRLSEHPGWREVYRDDFAVLFERVRRAGR
jgi:hypothetical protein